MQGETCIRCRKEVHPSNLIGGTMCFYCGEKTLHNSKMMAKVFEFFSPIYKFTPIITGVISLLYLIVNPDPGLGIMGLLIISAVIFVVCLFGMLGALSSSWTSATIEDRELNLKSHLKNYNLTAVSHCKYHIENVAVGRCTICFEAFCSEDFIYLDNTPELCRSCSTKAFMAEVNLSATLPALISTGLLCGVGIYYNVINSGYYGFSIGFLTFFSIILMIVVMILRSRRQFESSIS